MSLAGIAAGVGIASDIVGIGQSLRGPEQQQVVYDPKRIQRTVKDAQAAGVHPLFALGANIPAGQVLGPTSGSGVGDAVSQLGGSLSREATRVSTTRLAAAQAQQGAAESTSRIRMNETQAVLNEARSRSVIADMQGNPTVTSEFLDPSFSQDRRGRLQWFYDSTGKLQRVNQKVAPQEVLEREYGEVSELQGIHRALKGAKDWGGTMGWPTLNQLREIFTEKLYHNY